jgi:hypothetical protein
MVARVAIRLLVARRKAMLLSSLDISNIVNSNQSVYQNERFDYHFDLRENLGRPLLRII